MAAMADIMAAPQLQHSSEDSDSEMALPASPSLGPNGHSSAARRPPRKSTLTVSTQPYHTHLRCDCAYLSCIARP